MRNKGIVEKQLKYIDKIQTYVTGLDVEHFSENTLSHFAGRNGIRTPNRYL